MTTRRDLMKGASIAALGLVAPNFLVKGAYALNSAPSAPSPAFARQAANKKVLVVVQLSGGNDGLGTLIPHTDSAYFSARPTLAPKRDEVLRITDTLGLHPSLPRLQQMYGKGHVAVIQGVGYPNPNRSHFRSMQIWQTARPDVNEPTGWLGRLLEAEDDDAANTLRALNVGGYVPRSLWTETTLVPSITNLQSYQFRTDGRYMGDASAQLDSIHHLCEHGSGLAGAYSNTVADAYVREAAVDAFASSTTLQKAVSHDLNTVRYGNNPFAEGMRLISGIIKAGLGTRIFYISLGGFDTHAKQARAHADLLAMFDEGIASFYSDLDSMGQADRVAVMTFSEFGRRVAENTSGGTDHGTALPMLLIGGGIQGGIYGNNPDLSNLDAGDLRMQTDFRSVYASVIRDWLGGDPSKVIEGGYPPVPFALSRAT